MSTDRPTLDALRIHRPERPPVRSTGSRRILPVALLLVAAGGFAWWWMQRSRPIEVKTVTVRSALTAGDGGRTLLNASGYVTARREATVSSKITGKVMEVLVEEGMKVEEGQILARLDSSNVEASLRLAEAQLESARSAMEETRPNLEFARSELERFTRLVGSNAASQSDYTRALAETRALEGRLARQTADLLVAEREVAQWRQQVEDTIIRAPFTGVVTSKNAQPGEMISPMSAGGGFTRTGICTLVDMTSLEIEVDVNESFINRVQPEMPVEAVLDAYSDWRIPCRVIAIIPTADRQKATVKVRVGFEQSDPRILPEMGVKVAFRSADSPGSPAKPAAVGITVPSPALRNEDGRDFVWVVRDGRAERKFVTTARQREGRVVHRSRQRCGSVGGNCEGHR